MRRRWNLRLLLLGPVVMPVLAGMVGLGLISDFADRQHSDAVLARVATSTVERVVLQLRRQREDYELFARLLASQPKVASVVQQGDLVELAQVLVPLQSSLKVTRIAVNTRDGQQLLQVGSSQVGLEEGPLVSAALAGSTTSAAGTSGDGLAVAAATPITTPTDIVGALVVGGTLDESRVDAVQDQAGAKLAVYQSGRLVKTTVDDPGLLKLLRSANPDQNHLTDLDALVTSFGYEPAITDLPPHGTLVVLVPTHDFDDLSAQRLRILLVGAALLTVALLLIGNYLVWTITRPIRGMVAVARSMAGGDYRQRVAASSICELGELGHTVNRLADQLEVRISELDEQRRILALQYAVASALATGNDLGETLAQVLQAVGEGLGCEIGLVWADDGTGQRSCTASWHARSVTEPEVEELSATDGDAHASMAGRLGFTGTIAFPIQIDQRNLGMVEFFSHEAREADPKLVELLTAIGHQIAQHLDRVHAARTLRESEDRYRQLVELSPDAILVHCDGQIAYINAAGLALFGATSPSQLLGRCGLDFVPPEDQASCIERITETVQRWPGALVELRIIRLDGQPVDAEVATMPINWRGRRAVQAVMRDVTARKQAEAQLNDLRDRTELILASAGEGVVGVDRQGKAVFANPAAARITGYTVEELLGRQMHELVHHTRADGSSHRVEDCPIFAVLQDGVTRRVPDDLFWRKDGSSFPVEYVGTCVRDGDAFVGAVVTFNDITERKQIDEALRRSEARLQREAERLLALHSASTVLAAQTAEPDAVLEQVLRSAVSLVGAASGSLYRWDQSAGMLRSLGDWHVQPGHVTGDVPAGSGLAGHTLSRQQPVIVNDYANWEFANRAARAGGMRAGMGLPLMHAGQCLGVLILRVYDDSTQFTEDDSRIASLFADQAAAALFTAEAFEQQRRAAFQDALTDLPNRARLRAEMDRVLGAAGETSQPFALLLLDLDRFKEINDTLGHQAGDRVLQQVGPRFQKQLSEHDMLARLGGDEFAVVLPGANAQRARDVAERLLKQLELPFQLDGSGVELGASIGIALYPEHGNDADALLRRADVAMYAAKSSRSGAAVYAPQHDRHGPERLALVADLRRAIEHGELMLQYQPQVDVRSGALTAVEALARWPHPVRGLVSPQEFIALAEESRLIRPLSRWVLEAALRQCAEWRRTGLDLPVAVNLSAHDLQDPTLPAFVTDVLDACGVAPDRLRIEITESSLLIDPRRVQEILAVWRAEGVQIAIDDFGTGYSSLAYLKDLPVDELKIDRSFVKGMASDGGARAIVRAVIDLADDLGLRVVAEGVEDEATRQVLAALGCDVAQGYYFSPPLAAHAVADWAHNALHRQLAEAESSRIASARVSRAADRSARLSAEEEFIARKRAEEALGESEERLRLAVQAANIATWDWDLLKGTITWSGAVDSLFDVQADRTRDAFLSRVHPEDRMLVVSAVDEAISSTGQLKVEYRIVKTDGTVRWVMCEGRVFRDAGGRAVRLLGTDVDITARKEAELQREAFTQTEKLRALGQMASGIAHDLNQSFQLISGYGDVARNVLSGPELDVSGLREALAIVTQAAMDGGATVKRLLTFARAEADAEAKPLNLEQLVREVAQLTAPRWRDAAQVEGRGISLYVDASGDTTILGSPARLREMLTNLVFNAVDALPNSGTIRLTVAGREDRVTLEVADSGIGMTPEVQARMFEPFFTTKGARGTGLGLAQVFGIVEQHKGQIEVTSEAGRGATFRITLPAAAERRVESTVRQLRVAGPSRRLRILAVDDEPMIGKMVDRILRPAGHVVVTATSGEEALERLQTEVVDLVISDMGMGAGMNGWELADAVQRHWSNLPFVLATGWGAQIDPLEAQRKGVTAVIAKPYRAEDLRELIVQVTTSAQHADAA
jgi:diguanylate cyclase (GGDEF)-like protein/PAS domain S-box-containing protein